MTVAPGTPSSRFTDRARVVAAEVARVGEKRTRTMSGAAAVTETMGLRAAVDEAVVDAPRRWCMSPTEVHCAAAGAADDSSSADTSRRAAATTIL